MLGSASRRGFLKLLSAVPVVGPAVAKQTSASLLTSPSLLKAVPMTGIVESLADEIDTEVTTVDEARSGYWDEIKYAIKRMRGFMDDDQKLRYNHERLKLRADIQREHVRCLKSVSDTAKTKMLLDIELDQLMVAHVVDARSDHLRYLRYQQREENEAKMARGESSCGLYGSKRPNALRPRKGG